MVMRPSIILLSRDIAGFIASAVFAQDTSYTSIEAASLCN